jgi:hypothetical protein
VNQSQDDHIQRQQPEIGVLRFQFHDAVVKLIHRSLSGLIG